MVKGKQKGKVFLMPQPTPEVEKNFFILYVKKKGKITNIEYQSLNNLSKKTSTPRFS